MRALVTGAAGYLAYALVRDLAAAGIKDIRRMFRGHRPLGEAPADAQADDFIGDVRLRTDVERAVRDVDLIFHLAAQTSVYVAEADPVADAEANVLPILYILEACRARGTAPVVIHAGTVTEGGIPQRLPVDESAADAPCTVYDLHKLFAERYLQLFSEAGHVRGTTLRLANVYGPGRNSSQAGRGVLNAMIRNAIAGEPLKIYGSGEYLRDYLFIDDAAHAFTLAAQNPDAVDRRHFVIGTGEGHSIADAVYLVAELVGARCGRVVPVEHVAPPESLSRIETRNFVADSRAFRSATGWEPRVSLRTGIERTIDYFLAKETGA